VEAASMLQKLQKLLKRTANESYFIATLSIALSSLFLFCFLNLCSLAIFNFFLIEVLAIIDNKRNHFIFTFKTCNRTRGAITSRNKYFLINRKVFFTSLSCKSQLRLLKLDFFISPIPYKKGPAFRLVFD
jgi:hypothetical protein